MAEWKRPGHWTYLGDPAANTRDQVRFLCGDNDAEDKLVSDEEIAHAYTEEGTYQGAAALVCEHLAARFAREASKSVAAGGGMSTAISLDQRSKAFATQAKSLRGRAAVGGSVLPYCGGITISDKATRAADTNRVMPGVRVGQFDNPEIGDDELSH